MFGCPGRGTGQSKWTRSNAVQYNLTIARQGGAVYSRGATLEMETRMGRGRKIGLGRARRGRPCGRGLEVIVRDVSGMGRPALGAR